MDTIPTDVLRLIFRVYTQELSQSPTRLLAVSRRWNDTLMSSPLLWSTVCLTIDTIDTIPAMLEPKYHALHAYLALSEGHDIDIPLDIEIRWNPARDPKGDHRLFCSSTLQYNFMCPDPRCGLMAVRRRQLENLLTVLAGRSELRREKARANRINRWRSLVIDLAGFWCGPTEDGDGISISPLGIGAFKTMPNMERIVARECYIRDFYIETPKLLSLELNCCTPSKFPVTKGVEEITLCGRVNLPLMGWSTFNKLRTLEVSGQHGWKLPSSADYISLSTIIVDASATEKTLDSIGVIFNESRRLDTLAAYGMSPEAASYLLIIARKPRFHNLNLSSHLFRRRECALPSRDYHGGLGSWQVIGVGGAVTGGDISSTRALLHEMMLRGTIVKAVDGYMERIIHLVKLYYPEL